MDKTKILQKANRLKNLKRELEDLAKELDISNISDDKIYCGIISYHKILLDMIKEDFVKED